MMESKATKSQVKTTKKEIFKIVDNIDKKINQGDKDYILVIKKYKKKHSRLYLTDCTAQFWSKKLDREYFENLKAELKLTSSLTVFCRHFVTSLQNQSLIYEKDPNTMIISMELGIGQGLTMNCTVEVEKVADINEDKDKFKSTLRRFLVSLYDSKNAKQGSKKQDAASVKKPQQKKEEIPEMISPTPSQIIQTNKMTSRSSRSDLFHPNRKKRKGTGVKFTLPDCTQV